MKYNDSITENESEKIKEQIIGLFDKEIGNLQSQIDDLKKNIGSSVSVEDKIMQDFIQKNPELIATTVEEYFRKKNIDDQQKAISDNMSILLEDFNSGLIKTFIGKADAQVKIIEFYDYSCKFCAQMVEVNKKLIEANPDLAIIFIEIPILGPDSFEATKFATAVSMFDQNKYLQLQSALFNSKLPKNKENLIKIATDNGIDPEKLQKFIDDNIDKIEERLKKNGILFNNMKLQGAPTYIVGNEALVGAVSFDKINAAIAKARDKLNNKK